MRKLALYLFCIALAVGHATSASAIVLKYTEQVDAYGSLGDTQFTFGGVTITWTGETQNVTGGNGFYELVAPPGAVTVSLPAYQITAHFTDTLAVFVNQGQQVAGFADLDLGASILDTYNSGFATYDLTSEFYGGGNTYIRPDVYFPTDKGLFNMTLFADGSSFTAAPEPSSLALLGTGLAGLIGRVIGRRRNPRTEI
jgi:PEP-CTERM motif